MNWYLLARRGVFAAAVLVAATIANVALFGSAIALWATVRWLVTP